jgi:ribA/ribD-fused uncharacterized protein
MGKIDRFLGRYDFLSNFYICPVEYNGIEYHSAEAAFQAQKTLDPEQRKKFAHLNSSESKRLGRQVQLRRDWEEVKVDIMRDVLKSKFSHNILRRTLLNTGDEELIEGNSWGDRFWGVYNGIGENNLGKLLMEIREEMREK